MERLGFIDKNDLIRDLKALGVETGDNLFITIDIGKVEFWHISRVKTLKALVEVFRESVGEIGSIVFASYTSGVYRWTRSKNTPVFSRFSKPNTGVLPSYIVADHNSIRSCHPTNSVVGYGSSLQTIFQNHNTSTGSYSIMGDLANLPNSKHLMIGTLDKKNAPQSMHYAQEVLGITSKHPLNGLFKILYKDECGSLKPFVRRDIGGCSSGGFKLFSHLLIAKNLKQGRFGKADAVIMDAKASIDLCLEILEKNQAALVCDSERCFECRGHLGNRGFLQVMLFYLVNARHVLSKFLSKIFATVTI